MLMNDGTDYSPLQETEPASVATLDSSEAFDARVRTTRTRLAVSDIIIAFGTVTFITVLVSGWGGLGDQNPFGIGLLGALGMCGSLWWRHGYVVTRSITWDGNLSSLWTSIVGATTGMVMVSYFIGLVPPRIWVITVAITWLVLMTGVRLVLARQRDVSEPPVRVIVAGNTGDALATRLALRADRRTAYDVRGFVMDRLDENMPELVSQLALGSTDHLPHVAQRERADLVVVCMGALDAERFAPMVRRLNVLGVDVALSTGLSNVALRRVSLGHVSGRPLVRVTPAPLGGWHLGIKRALDLVGAGVLITLVAPLMMLIAIAIRIEDGGKAIFTQVRVGKRGVPFTIYKFRTMVNNAEDLLVDLTNDHDGPVFKMRGDPRITRVGHVLRKTSMDELPQLFNIIRGHMSLVGPRPLPVHEVEAAPSSFLDRQAVKPGLTGRWQVSGRSDTGFKELDELDRWYVDNWSLGQDLEILARTVPAVLLARGAR